MPKTSKHWISIVNGNSPLLMRIEDPMRHVNNWWWLMNQRMMMDSCVMSLTEGSTNSENQLETDQILFLFSAPKIRTLNGFGQFHFPTKMYLVVFGFLPFSAKKYLSVSFCHTKLLSRFVIYVTLTSSASCILVSFSFSAKKRRISFVFSFRFRTEDNVLFLALVSFSAKL